MHNIVLSKYWSNRLLLAAERLCSSDHELSRPVRTPGPTRGRRNLSQAALSPKGTDSAEVSTVAGPGNDTSVELCVLRHASVGRSRQASGLVAPSAPGHTASPPTCCGRLSQQVDRLTVVVKPPSLLVRLDRTICFGEIVSALSKIRQATCPQIPHFCARYCEQNSTGRRGCAKRAPDAQN
jgi:hypothetical protein